MATTLFLRGSAGDGAFVSGVHRGTNTAKLNGSTSGWAPLLAHTSRGNSTIAEGSDNTSTVAGATSGVEVVSGSFPLEWISLPLDAGVTISGTITVNLWALESNMSANVAINAIIDRLDSTGAIVSTIAQTARTTEVAVTTATVNNFTVTPTSTAMLKGERIRIRVYGDDAGTMASGFTFAVNYGRNTGAANGDSFITFNETFGFQTSDPAGSTLYLTDVAGPAVGASVEKEMWTARGDGVNSIVVNTTAGWTAPIQWTNTAGGTAVEWYSKPLQAFTLAGVVKLNLRALESSSNAESGIRAELAVCNDDGSGAAVWAAASIISIASLGGASTSSGTDTAGELTTSEAAVVGYLAGSDVAVSAGQRLRLRVFIDDNARTSMVTAHTCTLFYDGTSGGASGDSFITLPQSVTEYVPGPPWPQRAPALMFR